MSVFLHFGLAEMDLVHAFGHVSLKSALFRHWLYPDYCTTNVEKVFFVTLYTKSFADFVIISAIALAIDSLIGCNPC